MAAATRGLITRLGRENPRWGYVRIQGELLKLGISVSATTVANVLRASGLGPAPRRIGASWSEFLRAQAHSLHADGLNPATRDVCGADTAEDQPARQVRADDNLSPDVASEPPLTAQVGVATSGAAGWGGDARRRLRKLVGWDLTVCSKVASPRDAMVYAPLFRSSRHVLSRSLRARSPGRRLGGDG